MAQLDSVDAQIAVNGAFAQAEAFVARNLEGFDPSQVDEVAAIVAEVGQAFALNRLSFLAQVANDYPARTYGGGKGGAKKPWAGKSSGGGSSSGDGITPAQKNLIVRLLGEKDGADDVFSGDVNSLNKKTASDTIEALIALADIE